MTRALLILLSCSSIGFAQAPSSRQRPEPRVVPAAQCSPMHGGVEGVANNPPVWYRAHGVDSGLVAEGRGRLVVVVYGAKDRRNVEGANVQLDQRGAPSDTVGVARLIASAGKHSFAVRRVGLSPWRDTIEVRAGYSDTLDVGLGNSPICFT